MGINPQDFKVSEKLIRKRLGLSYNTVVIPYGCEEIFNENVLFILKKRFDAGSMFIRTKPDFLIIDKEESYFVEAKQRTKNVEAIQLLYNKFTERSGIKVIYSFPEFAIWPGADRFLAEFLAQARWISPAAASAAFR